MKDKLFLAVLLIINVLITSCEKKDKIVTDYWPDGKVKSELRYTNDKLNGLCRWYYSNGNPSMEVVYNMNVLNGESTRWYENGKIEEKANFVDNQYDGVVEEYNTFGKLVKKTSYKNGVLNGMFYQWYDNGKPFVEGEYLDGMMHGSWLMYYRDGSIGSSAVYDRGTGVQKGYSEGGAYQNAEIQYKNNVKDGEEKHFNIDGSVSEILIWKDGNYVGTAQ